MRITPVNAAEAVMEPFWDPALSGLRLWEIEGGVEVRQEWCWASFSWTRAPEQGPALRMRRAFGIDVRGYDSLLVSMVAPEGCIVEILPQTERGARRYRSPPSPAHRVEHRVPLEGAERLEALAIEVWAKDRGEGEGWLNWVGLQDSGSLPSYRRQWELLEREWEPYLQPADHTPRFQPLWGLLLDARDIEELREEHRRFVAAHGQSPYQRSAREAADFEPERLVSDFVNFWGDTRYCRERDDGKLLLGRGATGFGSSAALAGLIERDGGLLRLGARYALAIGLCGRWDDGMVCALPGSTFEHRAFVQSLCAHETALILDLAGELFTPLGREYLVRRIAEEALGTINYNTWRHEYIFHCNQLAWFSPGRFLAYAAIEKQWGRAWPAGTSRIRPYREIACRELLESLDETVLPDGGYVEGPTYFRCVARDGGLSLYYHARAEGKDFRSVLPPSMRRTGDFAEAISSTDEAADVIPICDAGPIMEQDTLAVMAAALPQSRWVTMLRKSLARTGGLAETPLAWKLSRGLEGVRWPPTSFVSLPDMGIVASTRALGAHLTKILVMGNRGGAGHTHEDKGSFVLECAGETFAMDPGTCDYSSPFAGILTHCQRHTMLVPVDESARPRPRSPIPVDVKPQATGDGRSFHASIDATPGWEGWYRRWVRSWDSPTPESLLITDEYEIERGSGVQFLWGTRLPVELTGEGVVIRGRRARCILLPPEGCAVRIETLPLFGHEEQTRVCFAADRPAGKLEVRVRLVL